ASAKYSSRFRLERNAIPCQVRSAGRKDVSSSPIEARGSDSMTVLPSVLEAIGNTPLIRLNAASAATGCEILGTAEFLNPGQSVKGRAALWIVRAAERSGALRPGGVIVEGTAGNTGIGLALVARALGHRTVIVIPETQS